MAFIIEIFGLSQRRASSLVGLCRNTLRYQPGPNRDEDLRKRDSAAAETVWMPKTPHNAKEGRTGQEP